MSLLVLLFSFVSFHLFCNGRPCRPLCLNQINEDYSSCNTCMHNNDDSCFALPPYFIPYYESDGCFAGTTKCEKCGPNSNSRYGIYMINTQTDIENEIKSIIDMGYNIIFISSWTKGGQAMDYAKEWENISRDKQIEIATYAKSKNVLLLGTIGGDEDYRKYDSSEYCSEGTYWALMNNLDGVNIRFSQYYGDASINWITECTEAAFHYTKSSYYIVHSPKAYFFGNWAKLKHEGLSYYEYVNTISYTRINFYAIEYFGEEMLFNTYDSIFKESSEDPNGEYASCSVSEITENNYIPKDKIVIVKSTSYDYGSGYVDSSLLAEWVNKAKEEGIYDGGLGSYAYLNDEHSKKWIEDLKD